MSSTDPFEDAAALQAKQEESAKLQAKQEAAELQAMQEEAAVLKVEQEEAAKLQAKQEEAAKLKEEQEEAAELKAKQEEAAKLKAKRVLQLSVLVYGRGLKLLNLLQDICHHHNSDVFAVAYGRFKSYVVIVLVIGVISKG